MRVCINLFPILKAANVNVAFDIVRASCVSQPFYSLLGLSSAG